jgi:hypothetical protein
MNERAKLAAKTSESKTENSASQTNKTTFSPSINSPIDQILFLQRTVGNQAVEKLLKSGFIQAKLTIGQPGDIYEQEADRMAEQVMRKPDPAFDETPVSLPRPMPQIQRTCAPCERELHRKPTGNRIQRMCTECEEELQRQPVDEAEEEVIQPQSISDHPQFSGTDFEEQLNAERSGGSPLPGNTRQFMESQFGADFGSVRIHTGENAAQLSASVQAQAFTVGNDIYFGSGQYHPESSSGNSLIAHELVHTIQQNPGTKRINQKSEVSISQVNRSVQRFYTFGPEPEGKRPLGTTVHAIVLPMFLAANSNLFIEAPIPGAKKMVPDDIEKAGFADFYRVTSGFRRTIGVRYQNDQFKFLEGGGRLEWSEGDYNHDNLAAPLGPENALAGCDGPQAKICRLNVVPKNVLLGDLKPGGSAEANLGTGQINDYKSGLRMTNDKVNEFITNHGDQVRPDARQWNLTSGEIPSLTIPPQLEYPGGAGHVFAGLRSDRLSVYQFNRKVTQDSGLTGALYVYKDQSAGVWSYEWFPRSPIPAAMGHQNINNALNRLNNEVIPNLQTKPVHSGSSLSPRLVHRPGIERLHYRSTSIQRQPKPFSLKDWENKHYGPWKKETKALLADKKKIGEVSVAAALVDLNKRSPKKVPISKDVETTGKGLSKLNHWVDWGGVFGRLRATFGNLFFKVAGIYEKIKKRFEKGPDKSTKTFDFGSGPIGAAVKVAFGLMKQFLKIIANRVAQNLTAKLKAGAEAYVKHLFSDTVIEQLIGKAKELETEILKVTNIGDTLHAKFDERVNEILKDYEDEIKFLDNIKAGLKTVGDILSIVKWGIRIFHCASPPLFGCIKLAFEALTSKLIEAIVKGCWFQEKAIRPLFNTIQFFKDLPQDISDAILKLLREIIPLPPADLKILLPPKIDVPEAEIGKGELKCAADKPTPEQEALQKLFDKHGEAKMTRMLKLLESKDVQDNAKLNLLEIQKIGKVMDKLSEDDLKKLEQNPDAFKGSDKGKDLEEVVHDIKWGATQEEFGETTGQLIETAEKTDQIAAKVIEAEAKGLFPNKGWFIQWNEKDEKNKQVPALYLTTINGEHVVASIEIQFIALDYTNKKVAGRIVNPTYFVNSAGELVGPFTVKFFEGTLEGGESVGK